ncbi:hypothetical protein DM02DRAFT_678088 [Periconia macrospinosa]|uniref:TPR-like protein n=1 Tax=Periconia macrospinosa TaxID=97972 RepID=A0A2V1D0C2_9PLEO|nr:hypothetical protein DM02DRAFT_678088 [Periconia macrospinosa]
MIGMDAVLFIVTANPAFYQDLALLYVQIKITQVYQGKYEAAEMMNWRALEGYEKALGKEHPDTLTSVYCFAYLLHHQHRYNEAILLYKRASSGYTTTLGPDHPTTQACLDHQLSLEQLLHRHEPRHEV